MGWDMDGVMACLKEAKDRAALAAAEATEQPVAWQLRVVDRDPPGEWVDVPRERAERLGSEPGIEARALYTRPPSEASRDERAAIRKEAFEEAAKVLRAEWLPSAGEPWNDGYISAMEAAVEALEATAMSRVDNPPAGK